jgi:hypothetical protein
MYGFPVSVIFVVEGGWSASYPGSFTTCGPRPEDSYQPWRVAVCDQETSCDEEAVARAGLQSQREIVIVIIIIIIIIIQ